MTGAHRGAAAPAGQDRRSAIAAAVGLSGFGLLAWFIVAGTTLDLRAFNCGVTLITMAAIAVQGRRLRFLLWVFASSLFLSAYELLHTVAAEREWTSQPLISGAGPYVLGISIACTAVGAAKGIRSGQLPVPPFARKLVRGSQPNSDDQPG